MLRTILALGAAWAMATGALAEEGEFKDWWAACDNIRECAAFGFADDANFEALAYLKLTRGAGAGDPPMIEVAGQFDGPAWRLIVDGKPVAGVPTLTRQDDRVKLTKAQSAVLAAAIANGTKLEVVAGSQRAPISLAGSSAALRWLDDQQKRAGTVTALVARGDKPASAVPPPPSPPLIRAAAAVSQAGLPSEVPQSVRGLMGDCDDGILDREASEPIIARLAPGVILYAPLCTMGAYNLVHLFVVADEAGRNPRRLDIRYVGGVETESMLMNVDFDPATQTLSNFEKGRGIGDCGAANTWVWTGQAFAQTDQSLMGVCKGVSADDWPTVFRSRAK
jgi:hypothetical protein